MPKCAEAGVRSVASDTLLHSSFDALDQGITIFDADLRLVFANKRFLELRELPAELGAVGTSFEAQVRFRAERGDFGPGDADTIVKDHVELARRFEAHRIERVRLDGTVLEIRGDPLPEGGFIATYTDITARKRTEEELEARNAELDHSRHIYEDQGRQLVAMTETLSLAHQELEAAHRTKSEFLANMSHELRTPLNAIIGFAQLVKDQALGPLGDAGYIEFVDNICKSGAHLLELIEDILDVSKIEFGEARLKEEDVDVADSARAVIAMLAARAGQGEVTLLSEVPEELPPLHADPRKLKQILINLVSNAVKFTQPGGKATLKVWCDRDSGYVFQIVDSGIGIGFDDIPKALAPFQQVDSKLNRQYEGTGLGLPLSKSLVELHGGYLDLQSEVGRGTTVTVRFPAERVGLGQAERKSA